jgi:hypothetical protein
VTAPPDEPASSNEHATAGGGGPSEPAAYEPTAEERAERARRADRATKGGLAALLCLEAFVVLLVPRAIAQTSGLSSTETLLLIALAIVLVATGFTLRRPWGIGLGSALQVLLAATIVLIPAIFVVVLFFLFLWWFVLRTRNQLVGTPDGWRMLVS